MSTKTQMPLPKSSAPRAKRPEDLLEELRNDLTMLRRGMSGYNKMLDGWKWLQSQHSAEKAASRVSAPPIISYKGTVDGVNVEDVSVDLSKIHPDVLQAFLPGMINYHGQETLEAVTHLINAAQQLRDMVETALGLRQAPPPGDTSAET